LPESPGRFRISSGSRFLDHEPNDGKASDEGRSSNPRSGGCGADVLPIRFDHSPEFQSLLAGAESPSLLRIALEIARDAYPELDIGTYQGKVDALAERIRTRCGRLSKPRNKKKKEVNIKEYER